MKRVKIKEDIFQGIPSATGISQETVYCGYEGTEEELEEMIMLLLQGLVGLSLRENLLPHSISPER